MSTLQVIRILIEEKLGYHVKESEVGSAVEQFYAMANCARPSEFTDRGCGDDQDKKATLSPVSISFPFPFPFDSPLLGGTPKP